MGGSAVRVVRQFRKVQRSSGKFEKDQDLKVVRESSSQPHTPKGTATLLSCPEPAKSPCGPAPGRAQGLPAFTGACMSLARMAMVAASYRRFAHPSGGPPRLTSDRSPERALNPRTPPRQGARRAWTPDRVPTVLTVLTASTVSARPQAPPGLRAPGPEAPAGGPAGLGGRRGALGGVQLRPGSRRPCGVRDLPGGSGWRRAGPGGRHRGLPGAAAAVRAGGRAAARGTERRAPRTAQQDGYGGAPGRAARLREHAGRLTDSHTRSRSFSANFRRPGIPWPNGPSTPVRPGLKGAPRACAPYGDRPWSRGALPCRAHECNAS